MEDRWKTKQDRTMLCSISSIFILPTQFLQFGRVISRHCIQNFIETGLRVSDVKALHIVEITERDNIPNFTFFELGGPQNGNIRKYFEF